MLCCCTFHHVSQALCGFVQHLAAGYQEGLLNLVATPIRVCQHGAVAHSCALGLSRCHLIISHAIARHIIEGFVGRAVLPVSNHMQLMTPAVLSWKSC